MGFCMNVTRQRHTFSPSTKSNLAVHERYMFHRRIQVEQQHRCADQRLQGISLLARWNTGNEASYSSNRSWTVHPHGHGRFPRRGRPLPLLPEPVESLESCDKYINIADSYRRGVMELGTSTNVDISKFLSEEKLGVTETETKWKATSEFRKLT